MTLTPTEGARFLLERERDDGASAVYRVAIYAPDATYSGRATLAEDGTIELADLDAPDELVAALRMLAKLTARSAVTKREAGLVPWPARVLRWRGPGRGLGAAGTGGDDAVGEDRPRRASRIIPEKH